MLELDHLDHLVLTVADLDATCDFYTRVLGMRVETFGAGRRALRFGRQKINLHQAGHEFEPKAKHPQPGSADLCFIAVTPLAEVITHLQDLKVAVDEGPVDRSGANGAIRSVYIRDPDANLIEISNYVD
jgi:catechol 2,3-dioxygenase-like lactoylglutathione lyase family enzyme